MVLPPRSGFIRAMTIQPDGRPSPSSIIIVGPSTGPMTPGKPSHFPDSIGSMTDHRLSIHAIYWKPSVVAH